MLKSAPEASVAKRYKEAPANARTEKRHVGGGDGDCSQEGATKNSK